MRVLVISISLGVVSNNDFIVHDTKRRGNAGGVYRGTNHQRAISH